ncbi:hypothetical protein DXG03_009641 [Asterophora parasitica]|uniref:Uncharacterized protein n=1 Tax=Asterophora parasitica TaxID=117018 RepID=A0A9P7GAP7_9AGAR|nr:hypothetical protein DXG03_009641 [Asterophora parasitica]
MAAPAPSQRPQGSGSGPSATWARSGEPGSAFSGLGRGRGRGSGRGRGGGRGGRGGARESKPIGGDSSTSDKPNTASKDAATPATKPATLPTSGTTDKTTTSSNAAPSPRPKANPRRHSRTVPPVVASPLIGATDSIPSSPSGSRTQNRRRRSQSGKSASTPKINVPAHDDNLLRPQRHRTGPVPQSAPIKDAPPHLAAGTFDIRNNIDALVERVRAVAMAENRPSTPGSHIDWAGDDDDSLPDLDDWGVTTTSSKTDIISPIVVGGLKPLPDVDIEPSSPVSNTSEILKVPISDGVPAKDLLKEAKASNDLNSMDVTSGAPITITHQAIVSAPTSAMVSLHPSLPAKPKATADVSGILPSSRQGPSASSRRNHSITTVVGAASPQPSDVEATSSVVVENRFSTEGLAVSIHSAQELSSEDPLAKLLPREGLAASIHAPPPGEITESKSAPSNISTYSTTTLPTPPEHRTHTRAHTVGRGPFPRPENNSRPSRPGYSSPRGGHLTGGGGFHARTHSSPPTGLHSHRTPAQRPVITGDAISRLARTIGNTTLSPGRTSTTVAPAHD